MYYIQVQMMSLSKLFIRDKHHIKLEVMGISKAENLTSHSTFIVDSQTSAE